MSDDIVARLLICAKYDPDQKEAIDEITRLRAELAAERERADRISAAADAKTEIMRKRADKWKKRAINAAEEVCDLHAELAAERESATKANLDFVKMLRRADALEAERDTLRALLREAREYTGYAAFYGDRIEADHAVDLCARIDATLSKGGGIE